MAKVERVDEAFCKDAVLRFFRGRGLTANATFNPNDPPDYDLVVDDVDYAFEVTTLADADIARGLPIQTVETYFNRIAADAERDAQVQGILRGTYFVQFPGKAIPHSPKTRAGIVASLVDYIRNTASLPQAAPVKVFEDADGDAIEVVKVSVEGRSYVAFGFGVRVAWDEQIVATAGDLLTKAVQTKSQSGLRSDPRPKVLGLLDGYDFASPSDYEQAFTANGVHGIFCGIFVVDSSGGTLPLLYASPPLP